MLQLRAEIQTALISLGADVAVACDILIQIAAEAEGTWIGNPCEITVPAIRPEIPLISHHSELITLPDPVMFNQLHIAVIFSEFLDLVLLDVAVLHDYVRNQLGDVGPKGYPAVQGDDWAQE